MSPSFESSIEALRNIIRNNQCEPFIRHIRFPFLKNLEENLRIDFEFPITAIVGPNGTNKSTILRALYGSPGDNSLGTYWFSTKIDSIKSSEGNRPCFIYGYYNADINRFVEVIKTRIEKKTKGDIDPDYWEPSRPIKKYGMESMPPLTTGEMKGRSETRWNTIEKKILYLDFRSEISAHDKFFHHVDFSAKINLREKKDIIRKRSNALKHAIKSGQPTYSYHGKDRIIEKINRSLSQEEVDSVSKILNRKYSDIKVIGHTFFHAKGKSVLIKVGDLDYSEAFAGSGEFAIVMLVSGVMAASPKSLILLDEPETSLHPGAQEKLMEFLMEQSKKEKHQIVFSTHSPTLIKGLPEEAIKVLMINSAGKVYLPKQKSLPAEAFFYLGEVPQGKKRILVEDVLSKFLVEWALYSEKAILSQIDIIVYPGGADGLLTTYCPGFSSEMRRDTLVLLDGDQRSESGWIIPEKDKIKYMDYNSLSECFEKLIRHSADRVHFPIDGNSNGGNQDQKMEQMRNYIFWILDFVKYLPGNGSPEEFILENLDSEDMVIKKINNSTLSPKEKFVSIACEKLYPGHGTEDAKPTSTEILQYQREMLVTIPPTIEPLNLLKESIRKFLE